MQFSQSLISDGYQLYTSGSGLTERNEELFEITACLKGWDTSIVKSIVLRGILQMLSTGDRELRSLCKRCSEVAQELLSVLEEMREKSGGRKWRAFQQALATVWRADKIAKL